MRRWTERRRPRSSTAPTRRTSRTRRSGGAVGRADPRPAGEHLEAQPRGARRDDRARPGRLQELGAHHAALRARLPHLGVSGGRCGTDARHVGAICAAWVGATGRRRLGTAPSRKTRCGHVKACLQRVCNGFVPTPSRERDPHAQPPAAEDGRLAVREQ
jgi:hypothetical protein